MADFNITIDDKALMAKLKKLSNLAKALDPAYQKTTRTAVRDYVEKTNKMDGNTRRGWTNVKKQGDSSYFFSNNIKTSDKKHLIVNILNYGRKEVLPKPSNKKGLLYIPLTNKGRSQDETSKFGIDFVMAKKAKAYAGTKFLDELNKKYIGVLVDNIKAVIRGI
jgi:hypothetical protein